MMSEHLLQRLDDPPIRTTVEVRKRQQAVREIRPGRPSVRFGRRPARQSPLRVCFPRKNRCDLVTNGWKVLRRQAAQRPDVIAFAASADRRTRSITMIKVYFYQSLTGKTPAAATQFPRRFAAVMSKDLSTGADF
jgi:hypothetical protein